MSRPVRVIGILVLVLAVGAGAVYVWRYREQQRAAAAAAAVRQAVVARGTLIGAVNATGHLAPQSQINLFFGASAPEPVATVHVEVGQHVAAEQVLAELKAAELRLAVIEAQQSLEAAQLSLRLLQAPPRPEDIAVAEANVRVAKNQVYSAWQGNAPEAVEIARLNLSIAQTALNNTNATMARLESQGRWADKQALQTQADRQAQEVEIARLRYEQAQQPGPYGPVAAAQAGVEQAEAALARLLDGPSSEDLEIAERRVNQARAALEAAQYTLSGAKIVSPFDGTVLAVNVRVGQPAIGGLPAIVLADVDRYYLDVLVDEVDVARVAAGQPVTVTLDALPDLVLAAAVEKIAPVATNNAGVVSYPVRLVLAPEGPAARLVRAGMTATAAIVVQEARDVVLVPNWAIRRDRETGEAFVSLLVAGEIREVRVELGMHDEVYSEVRSGVQPGAVVATDTARENFSLFGNE